MAETDILISGGGVAGLIAAAAFGAAGFRTLCVEPTPPATAIVRRPCSSWDFGPGMGVTRLRCWGSR